MKNLPEFSEKRNFDDQKTEKFSDLMLLIGFNLGFDRSACLSNFEAVVPNFFDIKGLHFKSLF